MGKSNKVLNFNSYWFSQLVTIGNPVNATDELSILWELELTREGDLDMELTFIHARRKSIFWNVQLKPTIHPLKALGSASVGEGGVVNDIYTTQVTYKRWRQSITLAYHHSNIHNQARKGKVRTCRYSPSEQPVGNLLHKATCLYAYYYTHISVALMSFQMVFTLQLVC